MDTFESKGLATAALLVFSIAAISQWTFGFYTANYYDSSLPENVKRSHEAFSNIDFQCDRTHLKTHGQK